MAWTAPPVFVPTQTPNASIMNTYVRDNLAEMFAANLQANQTRPLFFSTGANEFESRGFSSNFDGDEGTITGDSYGDLSGAAVGPLVNVFNAGSTIAVFLSCDVEVDDPGSSAHMSYEVDDDAQVISPSAGRGIELSGVTAGNAWRLGVTDMRSDVEPGDVVVTAKYRSTSGDTATFLNRSISVIAI